MPPSPSPLVVLTIWTALLLYTAGEYGRTRRPAAAWARPVWLLGAAAYLAHVAAAFATHHGWSHAAAYACTAARTEALVGVAWGGGLWVNYAFTVLWVGEALWWRMRPASRARRARAWMTAVRAAFLFMIVNGAVVFVDGPRRWLGVAVVAALIAIWRADAGPGGRAESTGRRLRRRTAPPPVGGADSWRDGRAAIGGRGATLRSAGAALRSRRDRRVALGNSPARTPAATIVGLHFRQAGKR